MNNKVNARVEIPSPVKKRELTSPTGPPSVLRRSKRTGIGPVRPNLSSNSTTTTNSVQWKLPEAPPVISYVGVQPQDSSNHPGRLHSNHRQHRKQAIRPTPGRNLCYNLTGLGLQPESCGRNGMTSKHTNARVSARVPAVYDSRPGVIYFELVPSDEKTNGSDKCKLTLNKDSMPALPAPPSSTLNIMQMPLESPVPAKTLTVDMASLCGNLMIPQSPNTPCQVYRKFVDEDSRGMVTPSANEADDVDLSTASRAMLCLSNAAASVQESSCKERNGFLSKSNIVVAPDTPTTPNSNGCLDFLAFAATMPTPSNNGEVISSEGLTSMKKLDQPSFGTTS